MKWWENFVNVDRGRLHLGAIKKQFHATRITSGCVLSLLHIVVALGSMYALDAADQYAHYSPFAIRTGVDVTHNPTFPFVNDVTTSTTTSVPNVASSTASDLDAINDDVNGTTESMLELMDLDSNASQPSIALRRNSGPDASVSSEQTAEDSVVLGIVPAVLCISASCVAYYLAALASKLLMQKFSFALPVVLSSPVLVAIMYMKHYGVFGPVSHSLQM